MNLTPLLVSLALTAQPVESVPPAADTFAETPVVDAPAQPVLDAPLLAAKPASTAPSALASTGTLTLQAAIDTALSHNVEAKIATNQSRAARAQAMSSRANLLPHAGLNASYGFDFDVPYGRPNQLNQNFNTSVSAEQLIFDFGRSQKRWHSSLASARATEQSELATRQAIILDVRLAYLDLLETHALVEVGQRTLKNNERHLEQTRALVEAGTRPTIDLVKLRTEVASAKASLIQAEGNERIARARMGFLMGQPLPSTTEIAEERFEPLSFENLPPQKLFERSLTNRPEFAAQRATIQASSLQLEATKKDLWPTISAVAGLGWNWQHISESSLGANVGLRLNWTLFDGMANKGATEAAHANLTVEELRLTLKEQQIYTAIEEALLNVASAQSALAATQEALAAAEELLKSAEERYVAGVGNIIELTDAQFDVAEAESRRVRSYYELAAARSNLLQAVGVEAWSDGR
ncbi:MAG: TolC family protein [Myxococcales bacterium]|jgi:outer membrane protein|nr:TolC family protein [Myxococcales bacterium]